MLLMFLGLICFAVLAILRRDLALYLIVLLLPTYQIRFSILGIPATFLEGMILILAAASLLPLPRRERIEVRGRLTANKWTIVFISFFLLAAFISVFTSPNLTAAAGIFKAYFFEAVLFSFLVMLIIDSSEKLQRLYKTLALLVLYLSIFGIYQFITLYNLPFNWWAVDVESRRIISLLNHPNALALLIGPILAMLIMLRGSQKSVLYWSAIILGLVALYLSFSRASWLALLVTVIGITIIHHRSPSPPLRVRGGWGALLLSIIVILVLTIPFSRAKLLDLARGRDLSQQNRYVLWSAAGDILKNSPITGTGLAGFREAYKNYPLGPDLVVQNYPHNFFLNFWTETGLLGLISILGLLTLFFKKIYSLLKSSSPLRGEDKGGGEKSLALAAAAGMAMILLHGLVDVPYFKNDLSVLFWLIYALPYINYKL